MSRPPRIPGTSSGRALYLLPGIPDNLDEETKNGLAIRNAASANGICPDCGTVGQLHPDKQLARVWHLVFEHQFECRAATDGQAA